MQELYTEDAGYKLYIDPRSRRPRGAIYDLYPKSEVYNLLIFLLWRFSNKVSSISKTLHQDFSSFVNKFEPIIYSQYITYLYTY